MTNPPFQAAAGQQGPQIQVRNLFATPVAIFPVPEAVRINSALETRIFEREKQVPSVHHSNWGGWQSATDFPDWCGPEGQTLFRRRRSHLDRAEPGAGVSAR